MAAEGEPPRAPDHALTVIRGTPRERGRQYGRTFQAAIESFLDREIYGAFAPPKAATKDAMLRYAARAARRSAASRPRSGTSSRAWPRGWASGSRRWS